jgi:hypothetical protein
MILCLTSWQEVVTAAQQAGSSQQFTSNQYTVHIDRIANIFRFVRLQFQNRCIVQSLDILVSVS